MLYCDLANQGKAVKGLLAGAMTGVRTAASNVLKSDLKRLGSTIPTCSSARFRQDEAKKTLLRTHTTAVSVVYSVLSRDFSAALKDVRCHQHDSGQNALQAWRGFCIVALEALAGSLADVS